MTRQNEPRQREQHVHMTQVQCALVRTGHLSAYMVMLMYRLHMKRVQVQLTDSQLEALRKHADATGEGMAAAVRDALDAWIARRERQEKWERAFLAVGAFHSGLGDLAERHDDYLNEDAGW